MSAPTGVRAEAGLQVDLLLGRYTYGVNLLNAAVRNAATNTETFSPWR